MDTNRIIINNYDLSSSMTEEPTKVVGYTVVKAPKGPKTPVRVPARNHAMFKDIFGEASVDFPDLHEASNFLSSYDLYVSAPYGTNTKIPVAYVTPRGVFPREDLVTYDENIEDVLNGIPKDIEGITQVTSPVNVLMDTRYPKSDGLTETSNLSNDYLYPSYDTEKKAVVVNLGLSVEDVKNELFVEELETDLLKGRTCVAIKFKHSPVLIGNNAESRTYEFTTYMSLPTADDSTFTKVDTPDKITGDTEFPIFMIHDKVHIVGKGVFLGKKTLQLEITGMTDSIIESSEYRLTTTRIINEFSSESSRENIRTYYIYQVKEKSDIYGTMFAKYPSENAMHISFAPFNADEGYIKTSPEQRNVFSMKVYEDNAFHASNRPISVLGSLNPVARDAKNAPIGFGVGNKGYMEQNLISVVPVNKMSEEGLEGFNMKLDCYTPVVLEGGTRDLDTLQNEALYNVGWEQAEKERFSDVNIFFKSSPALELDGNVALPTRNEDKFFGLADVHKLAGFMFNITPTNKVLKDGETVTNSIKKLSYGPSYWNVSNIAIVNVNNGGNFNSSMVGLKAQMQGKIIEKRYGGVAPMYLNSDGLGGQLDIPGYIRLKYEYNKDEQSKMDKLNFNPIIHDSAYGTLSTGHKTCKDSSTTDWSYIAHVCSFYEFEREVREKVMIPQLGKANNEYYRTQRKQQVEQILSRRLEGSTRIWNAGVVDTSTNIGVNDITAQRAKKFVINVKVKVEVTSEFVELNFMNVDLDTQIG